MKTHLRNSPPPKSLVHAAVDCPLRDGGDGGGKVRVFHGMDFEKWRRGGRKLGGVDDDDEMKIRGFGEEIWDPGDPKNQKHGHLF